MATLLVKNIHKLVTMDDEGSIFSNGALFIRDKVVEQIGPTAELPVAADYVIDGCDMIILPGLINTHHHLYQTLTRAVPAAQNASLFQFLSNRAQCSIID